MRKAADAPSKARYHHGDLRRALLEAALSLVASRGVEAFSLREAAREVGVSPAAAYRHFADKAALLTALAADGMGRLATAMEQALEHAPGAPGTPARAVADLAAVGTAYVEFAVRHPAQFGVMFGPWCPHEGVAAVPPEIAPRGRDPYQILVDCLDGLVATGAMPGAVREGAELAAWAAVHGLAGLTVSEALRLGPAERALALSIVMRTVLQGLGCPASLLTPPRRAPDLDPRPPAARRPRRS
ncbi:MAG: WHG domain-containing protein [Anaeromyxobacteraceae bacterium]|nr:WHG domain-containing protein [Anaeromyxobacteraceae bacterium]